MRVATYWKYNLIIQGDFDKNQTSWKACRYRQANVCRLFSLISSNSSRRVAPTLEYGLPQFGQNFQSEHASCA